VNEILIAVTSPEGADIYHLPGAYLRIVDVDNLQCLFHYNLAMAATASGAPARGRLLCKLTRKALSRWSFKVRATRRHLRHAAGRT